MSRTQEIKILENSLAVYDEHIMQNPQDTLAWSQKATALLKLNQLEPEKYPMITAVIALTGALNCHLTDDSLRTRLADILLEHIKLENISPKSTDTLAEEKIHQANDTAMDDLLAEAAQREIQTADKEIEDSKQWVEFSPAASTYNGLSEAYRKKADLLKNNATEYRKNLNLSLEALDHALQKDRANSVYLVDKAKLLVDLGRTKEARITLETVNKLKPYWPTDTSEYYIQNIIQECEKAIAASEPTPASTPVQNTQSVAQVNDLLFKAQQKKLEDADKAIEKQLRMVERLKKGSTYFLLAVRYVNKADLIQDNSTEYQTNLQLALNALNTSLQLDETYLLSIAQRAVVYAKLGEKDKAETDVELLHQLKSVWKNDARQEFSITHNIEQCHKILATHHRSAVTSVAPEIGKTNHNSSLDIDEVLTQFKMNRR
ncbi:MAG: hypothetical protein SFW66_03975 [Gammaproteobacteria bacterium]|nr:hypothetical protein [Gammaproteobacteria bacterium]